MLAMMVAGFMAKQGAGAAPSQPDGGGLGGILGGLIGVRSDAGQGSGPGGGLGSLLDMNGDGNALDDIMRMAQKAMR
jgi:hypothetical protein